MTTQSGKLTAAMLVVLRRFGAGSTATTLRPEGGSWWSDRLDDTAIRTPTLFALRERDLIHGDFSDYRWIKWTITTSGRQALTVKR